MDVKFSFVIDHLYPTEAATMEYGFKNRLTVH